MDGVFITKEELAEMRQLAERVISFVARIEQQSTQKVEKPTPKVEQSTAKLESDLLESYQTPPTPGELNAALRGKLPYVSARIAFVNEKIGLPNKRDKYTKQQWEMFKYTFMRTPADLMQKTVSDIKRIAETIKPLKFKQAEPFARKLVLELMKKGWPESRIREYKQYLANNMNIISQFCNRTEREKYMLLKYHFGICAQYHEHTTLSWADIQAQSIIKPYVNEQGLLFGNW